MASKKTQRAITAADVPCVFDDDCIDRLAELLARHKIKISAEARHEIEQCINWYRSRDSWRGQGPRIEIPPEFEKMRKAAIALASRLKDVSIVRAVPNHLKHAHGDSDHFKLVGIDCVVSIFSDAELIDAHGKDLPDEQAIEDRLEGLLADLDWLASRVTAAQRHGKHRGRKTDRPQHFVKLVVSAIKRDKGQRIKRSTNKDSPFELLKDIAAVVGIGPFTVEEVVRARQKRLRRGEISRGKR
jgi:hypothetical protein